MSTEEPDRRQQILDAALEEFAHKGFRGATIKSIAQTAGLQSPSLIYWYFPTKEDLFQAIIQSHSPFLQAVFDPTSLMEKPPEEVLPFLARGYLEMAGQGVIPRLARLIISEIVRRPEMADMMADKFLLRVLGFLKNYLAHQVELGRLRPHDTRASARAFMGMLMPQALSLLVFPSLLQDGLTSEEHVETAVSIFLSGLKAESQ